VPISLTVCMLSNIPFVSVVLILFCIVVYILH
jgi:hypothetical protein